MVKPVTGTGHEWLTAWLEPLKARAFCDEKGCVMTGQCCRGGRISQWLTRRVSRVTASILPAMVLVFLPKCPLCLAAWLTVATGISFTEVGAGWVRWSVVLLSVVAFALVIWRSAFERIPGILRRHG